MRVYLKFTNQRFQIFMKGGYFFANFLNSFSKAGVYLTSKLVY